jgi:glycosyltransferase involved in cell wall biosynthesis
MTSTEPARRSRFSREASARPGVLHVITGTARRGAETFAVDLAEALAERGRSGRTVALAGDTAPGALPVDVLGRRPRGAQTLRALRREARRARVVVAHGSSAVVACAIATLGTRTPFVYRNIGDPSFWLDTPRRRRQMRWILGRASATVALWDSSATQLRALGGRAIEIIPTGVPARLFPPIEPEERRLAREHLGLDPSAPVAVYVGSLSDEKNVGVAVSAIAAIEGATLLLVGDGPDRASLEELAARTAPGRIRFIGTRERPRQELAAADVLVLPSKTEGIPAVLIEAAFSELPVVASDVGGIPQIVAHGRTGYLIPPGDSSALAAAVREAMAGGRAMGRAAREHCTERFEIGPVADAWESLLSGLGAWSETR